MSYITVTSSFVSPKRRTVNTAFFGPQFVNGQRIAAGQPAQVEATPIGPHHTRQFVPSIAIGSVATMLTIGGRFVGGGGGGRIVTLTGSETVDAPPLSVAFAVKSKFPTGALLQTRKKMLLGHAMIAQPGQFVGGVTPGIVLPNPRLFV